MRALLYVARLALVHTGITLAIGAVLLFGYAGIHFLEALR
jgi:hypothetical protein